MERPNKLAPCRKKPWWLMNFNPFLTNFCVHLWARTLVMSSTTSLMSSSSSYTSSKSGIVSPSMLKTLHTRLRAFVVFASKVWTFICYVFRKQTRAVSQKIFSSFLILFDIFYVYIPFRLFNTRLLHTTCTLYHLSPNIGLVSDLFLHTYTVHIR